MVQGEGGRPVIVSIMQPYFFPYIGYLQLIAHSDIFVFLDDVQYIKDAWVNRNRILGPTGQAVWLTFPVAAAGHTDAINARTYLREEHAARILRRIEGAYRKAPCFDRVFPVIREIMEFPDANVAAFNINLLQRVAALLQIGPRFRRSSDMSGLDGLTGQARVIAICDKVGATEYVNSIGGTRLYAAEAFRAHGMGLGFLETTVPPRCPPLSHLSILDLLMNQSPEDIAADLRLYRVNRADAADPRTGGQEDGAPAT